MDTIFAAELNGRCTTFGTVKLCGIIRNKNRIVWKDQMDSGQYGEDAVEESGENDVNDEDYDSDADPDAAEEEDDGGYVTVVDYLFFMRNCDMHFAGCSKLKKYFFSLDFF